MKFELEENIHIFWRCFSKAFGIAFGILFAIYAIAVLMHYVRLYP